MSAGLRLKQLSGNRPERESESILRELCTATKTMFAAAICQQHSTQAAHLIRVVDACVAGAAMTPLKGRCAGQLVVPIPCLGGHHLHRTRLKAGMAT